ncbi:threonine-phosphate decarboxylase CobD [Pararhizobium mangrovi]|uniref:threonine-phosphate decarboxylase n=1 Tax=Pararhizobium mangrovi TaxID=2590452 RepID=A0A506UEU1_9HYPH|nr:threonine-phosphate decarboxylase CobD [Pararhizobium mangrovi]TPW31299.1 threonine-phosphate decarboxylase [Pararhizobium mangrovi]
MGEAGPRHGGDLDGAIARYGGRPEDWLDLSTGINPLPPILPAIPQSAWARLPDRHLERTARTAAARFYGAAEGTLPLAVPGVQAIIRELPFLMKGGERAAILSPTYGEYSAVLERHGFAVDAITTLDAVDERHGLVVVVNPNNPDGRVTPRGELLSLNERLSARNATLVVDEAFADADPAESLANDAGQRAGLVVLRSFGKMFGLAGIRLGFVLARDDTLDRLRERIGPWAVSGPALALASAILGDDTTLAELRETIRARHIATADILAEAGLAVEGKTALFFLVDHLHAGALHDHLARRHILTRPFDYAPRWLRFGLLADRADEARLADALRAFGKPR